MGGKIIGVLTTGSVGVIITVIGWLIWKKQKINLMHDYHIDRVSEEDKAAFCRLSGIGLVIVGAGLIITAVLLGITDSAYSFLCFAVSFAAGLALLITAGRIYNR